MMGLVSDASVNYNSQNGTRYRASSVNIDPHDC